MTNIRKAGISQNAMNCMAKIATRLEISGHKVGQCLIFLTEVIPESVQNYESDGSSKLLQNFGTNANRHQSII